MCRRRMFCRREIHIAFKHKHSKSKLELVFKSLDSIGTVSPLVMRLSTNQFYKSLD